MKIIAKCTEVREGEWNGKPCVVVVASGVEAAPKYPIDLEAAKRELKRMNIRLGQANLPQSAPPMVNSKESLRPRMVITGRDSFRQPKTALAEEMECLSLSCGGEIIFLYLLTPIDDARWMKGQDLELTELSTNGSLAAREQVSLGK